MPIDTYLYTDTIRGESRRTIGDRKNGLRDYQLPNTVLHQTYNISIQQKGGLGVWRCYSFFMFGWRSVLTSRTRSRSFLTTASLRDWYESFKSMSLSSVSLSIALCFVLVAPTCCKEIRNLGLESSWVPMMQYTFPSNALNSSSFCARYVSMSFWASLRASFSFCVRSMDWVVTRKWWRKRFDG